VFIMIAGLFFVSVSNWDEGRFLPYGWSGVKNISNQLLKFKSYITVTNNEENIALSCSYNRPLCPTGHAGCSHLLLCFYWVRHHSHYGRRSQKSQHIYPLCHHCLSGHLPHCLCLCEYIALTICTFVSHFGFIRNTQDHIGNLGFLKSENCTCYYPLAVLIVHVTLKFVNFHR